MAHDEWAPHQDEIEALDAYWESLLNGAGLQDRPVAVDDVSVAVDGLYALDDTPAVDWSFARELEGKLMDQMQTASGAAPTSGLAGPHTEGSQLVLVPTDRASRTRRPSLGSLVATAALLLITLGAGLVAIRWGDGETGRSDPSVLPHPQESPATAECDVIPRMAAPAANAGTPVPPPIAASHVLPNTRLLLEVVDLPTGEAASVAEVAGISETLRVFAACELLAEQARDRGDIESTLNTRALEFALFTDDYLRRHVDPTPEPTPEAGTPTPPWWSDYWEGAAWTPGSRMPVILSAIRLPNARIGALLGMDQLGSRHFVVFVQVGDRWLIDEVAVVAPEVTTPGTPSAEELARSGPAIALLLSDVVYTPPSLGMPPQTAVALTLTNVGQVRHTFNIDDLAIHVELQPGETTTMVIQAPAGTYDFYCSVPGHKDAGMTGTLFVDPAYQVPVPLAAAENETTTPTP